MYQGSINWEFYDWPNWENAFTAEFLTVVNTLLTKFELIMQNKKLRNTRVFLLKRILALSAEIPEEQKKLS